MSMAEVIESIERESLQKAVKREEDMSLVEYAERIAPFPLSDFQKELIAKYEEAEKKNLQLFVSYPRNVGREFVYKVIQEWKMRNELKEHRCSCGRLLGRFNGQAEVKCPKCGKMNVIGVENHADSSSAR